MNRSTSDARSGLAFEIDRDHVGWLTFDLPDSSANLLTPKLMEDLEGIKVELNPELEIRFK